MYRMVIKLILHHLLTKENNCLVIDTSPNKLRAKSALWNLFPNNYTVFYSFVKIVINLNCRLDRLCLRQWCKSAYAF